MPSVHPWSARDTHSFNLLGDCWRCDFRKGSDLFIWSGLTVFGRTGGGVTLLMYGLHPRVGGVASCVSGWAPVGAGFAVSCSFDREA